MTHLGKASCGSLIRNALGEYLGGFVANLGSCPITIAEIWRAFYALEMAWNRGLTSVILELDSLNVVHLIQSDLDSKHPYGTVIRQVKNPLKHSWLVRIQHTYRESNRAANFMALWVVASSLGFVITWYLLRVLVLFLERILLGFLIPY